MEKFNSLREISEYAHTLLRDNKCTLIREIPAEEIIHLFVAAERYIQETTNNILHQLGINKRPVRTKFVHNLWEAGVCYDYFTKTEIEISSFPLFLYSYEGLLSVMVHEVCHIGNLLIGHRKEFWCYYFNSMKKLNIFDDNAKFDELFTKDSRVGFSPKIAEIIRNHFAQDVLIMRRKILIRHKVFERGGFKSKYISIVKKYCRMYQLDYNLRYRRNEIGDLSFEGIESTWNNQYHCEQYYNNLRKIVAYREWKANKTKS